MKLTPVIVLACFTACCAFSVWAQDVSPAETPPSDASPVLRHRPPPTPQTLQDIPPQTVDLSIPKGASLQVVLDREVRVQKVGQPVLGHLLEPVYSFDKLLLPVGTEVAGRIVRIAPVSARTRTLALLDANFTPTREVTVEFAELALPDGHHLPIHTLVAPGSDQVIRFVTAAANPKKKSAKDRVTEKERQAKEDARKQFNDAMQQVRQPGRWSRAERYGVAQLPVHPQYIAAGSLYSVEFREPLQFGSEPLAQETAAALNTDIPQGSMIHASLRTSLNSARTRKGDEVEAVVSRPLLSEGKLLLPQGSLLRGTVVQVQPARYWKHNGELRFVFRDLVLPNGVQSKVEAMLQGVQSAASDRLQLDSEGGATPKTPKTRYLTSGIAVGLAAATHEDEVLNRAEGGAGGFRVVGIVIGAAVHSQPLAIAMGALGATRSIYRNFISRGTEVVFPEHTAMEISIDTRATAPPETSPAGIAPAAR